jgi:amidase
MKDGLFWAEQLKTKQISFQEYVEEIERNVLKENPLLNALVTFDKESALKQYNETKNIQETPFAGLPIPLKMLGQSKKDWLTTSGSRLFINQRASKKSHFFN